MHHATSRRASRRVYLAIGAVLVAVSATAGAQQDQQGAPFRVKLERIELTIHSDYSYSEQIERRFKLTSLAGVQYARSLRIGPTDGYLPGMIHPLSGGKVVEAYLLKPDGKRIPAVPAHLLPSSAAEKAPPAKRGITPGNEPMQGLSLPQAAVGDVLVTIYQGEYPPAPGMGNNVVLDEAIPRTLLLDDGEITVNAPAAMKLRFRQTNVPPAKRSLSGSMRHWTWKFSIANPVTYRQDMSSSDIMASVHVSSLPSDDAEADFMDAREASLLAKSMPGGTFGCNYPGIANDGPSGRQAMTNNLSRAYIRNPIAFEQMVSGLNSPDCVFDDGRAKVSMLGFAYSDAFAQQGWDKSYEYIKTLQRRFPHSAFVALAEADYWMAYAWEARGGGYAGSVTEEGWKLFGERMRKAEKVLLDSKPYAANYPEWYDDMMSVEHLLDRSAHQQAVVLEEGLKRYPSYYALYFSVVNLTTPKWGGSWEAVDRFVNWSVDTTKKQEGQTMYARLYWYAYQNLLPDETLFGDTKASWPRMKQGFQDLMSRHPKSQWNLNNFAHFACMAGDRHTYRKLRRKMGKDVVAGAWANAPALDTCKAKYGI